MVDFAKIIVKAGDGGKGMVHFLRTKYQPKGGPDGGDGGDGGSEMLETDTNLNTLSEFRYKKKFEANKGGDGYLKKMSGKKAEDLVIKVPVGTLLRQKATEGQALEKKIDLDKPGMKIVIARGGKGGRGNWHFRSATNQAPQEAEPGTKGEVKELELELKLLADVGLIGLPNAGKSTMLSVLTKAHPVIADYPFTTLEPNLGVLDYEGKEKKSLVIADIPGLIEGASQGKGLGDEFLRHIERCKLLVHVVAVGAEKEQLWKDYLTIRKELGEYNGELLKKEEVVVLNKIDILPEGQVEKIMKFFGKKKVELLPLSAAMGKGMGELRNRLIK